MAGVSVMACGKICRLRFVSCVFLLDVITNIFTGQAQENPDMAWVKRHSWQSWRERYRKRQDIFDPRIERYVELDPPRDDGKGRFQYKRGAVSQAKQKRKAAAALEEEEEEEVESL
jgi:hypothetical protein